MDNLYFMSRLASDVPMERLFDDDLDRLDILP
jgi:hypothetical protein